MNKFSAKYKIYALVTVWLVGLGLLFGYFFNLLQEGNKTVANAMMSKQVELQKLEAEQRSYQQAKKDLEKIKQQPLQPADLFSNDVSLVNEIKTLERLSNQYNVDMTVAGITGTIKNVSKVHMNGDLYVIPANVTLMGKLSDIIGFIEHVENLSFVTKATGVTMTAQTEGTIQSTLTINFYLKQH